MSDETQSGITANTIAGIVATYLRDRDDIATTTIAFSETDGAFVTVETQGGASFSITIEPV